MVPYFVHLSSCSPPYPSATIEVHTDTSGIGLGAFLIQHFGNAEHAIAYASHSFSEAKHTCTITEHGCLAVAFAVCKFRSYLYGHHFTIVNDHHSLHWLVCLRDSCDRIAQWTLHLKEFHFAIHYKSDCHHVDADCISRLLPLSTACDTDNFDEFLAAIGDTFFANVATFLQ